MDFFALANNRNRDNLNMKRQTFHSFCKRISVIPGFVLAGCNYKKHPKTPKKANADQPTDRPTDRPTDGHSGS